MYILIDGPGVLDTIIYDLTTMFGVSFGCSSDVDQLITL